MVSNELLNDSSMMAKASEMRAFAQDRIVRAFRSQIEGKGQGPFDGDLQSFARLALVENTLRRSCLTPASAPLALGVKTIGSASATFRI